MLRCGKLGPSGLLALLVLWLPLAASGEPPGSLALLGAGGTASGRILSEGDWARELARVLGLEESLPPEPEPEDLFGLLCPEGAELSLAAGGRRLPEDGSFRVAVEAPRPARSQEPVRHVVEIPATGLYQLSVEGVGAQRWVIDQRPVGHLDLSPLGVAQAEAVVPLRHGPHEVSGYLAGNARVDRFELVAYRALCIAPADGWHGDRPLRHGALARTLVRSFELDRRLPEVEGSEQSIEGERFESASAGGEATRRALRSPASGQRWAEAVMSPAEFTWSFHLEEPGVVTISARTHGVLPQLWSLDGRYRVTVLPESVGGDFYWNHVVTLPLASGRHALRGLVSRGSGVDVIRVTSHRSSDADYARVVSELGFRPGAPGAPVTRAEADATLGRPALAHLARGFRLRLAGDLRDRSLVLIDAEPPAGFSRALSPLLPAEL